MDRWFSDVIGTLNEADVRYLVVGGVAVLLHGHQRFTKDLDLVIELKPANLSKALDALSAAGYRPIVPVSIQDFADPAKRQAWRREKNMLVFQLWHQNVQQARIDVFVHEPFDFDTEYALAPVRKLHGVEARVPRRELLIELKRAAGRPQDLADIHALEVLRDHGPSTDTE